jgi:hypothetical protein
MRLIATVIVTIAIAFALLYFLFPNFRENFSGFTVKKPAENINGGMFFTLNSSYAGFSSGVVGDISIEGNIALKTSLGTFENAKKIRLVNYKGSVAAGIDRINLSGEFNSLFIGETKISTNGKVNDGTPFGFAVINTTFDETRIRVNGQVTSEGKTVPVEGVVMIEKFSGSIRISPREKIMNIEGTSKNVTLLKSIV